MPTDLVITAANVLKTTATLLGAGVAGATITAGKALYLDGATSTLKLAGAGTAVKAACVGIALNGATAGQPVSYAAGGNIDLGTLGVPLVRGDEVVLSATDGNLTLRSQLVTGNYYFRFGPNLATTVLTLEMNNYQVTVP